MKNNLIKKHNFTTADEYDLFLNNHNIDPSHFISSGLAKSFMGVMILSVGQKPFFAFSSLYIGFQGIKHFVKSALNLYHFNDSGLGIEATSVSEFYNSYDASFLHKFFNEFTQAGANISISALLSYLALDENVVMPVTIIEYSGEALILVGAAQICIGASLLGVEAAKYTYAMFSDTPDKNEITNVIANETISTIDDMISKENNFFLPDIEQYNGDSLIEIGITPTLILIPDNCYL